MTRPIDYCPGLSAARGIYKQSTPLEKRFSFLTGSTRSAVVIMPEIKERR
jgi:hypothetical protein